MVRYRYSPDILPGRDERHSRNSATIPSGEMKSRRAPTPLSSFDPKRKKRKFSLRDRRTTLFGSSSYLSSSGGNRICRGGNEPSKIPAKTGISRCDFYLYFRSEEDSGKKKKTALGQQRIQWKVYVHADILFQCDNAEDALFRKICFFVLYTNQLGHFFGLIRCSH